MPSEQKKIDEKELVKALSTLQDLAKGHNSRGTNSTEVESMDGEGGSTQVHHTPSNSDPAGGWAGSASRDVAENGASDAIDENGTDYNGGAEMVKSIKEKLSKGQALTAAEYSFVVEKGMPPFLKKDDDKDAKKDDKDVEKALDEDDDKDVKKSLADEASANDTVAQGMEISEFLAEFVGVINKSLSNMEQRVTSTITDRVLGAVSSEAERSEAFGKSLASALGTLGEGLVANSQRVDQVEQTPARGPRSQQVESVNKSLGQGEELSKAIIAATMTDMVQKGSLGVTEVVRFESNGGQISEELLAKVQAHRAGK